jgi:hypothetical protein
MYTMGCYLTIKENEIMSLVGKWLELEVMLSLKGQASSQAK